MPFTVPDSGFEFWCDGKDHALATPVVVIFGLACDCPPPWSGPLDQCPGCNGRGYTLVDDGGGHKDELDCERCSRQRATLGQNR